MRAGIKVVDEWGTNVASHKYFTAGRLQHLPNKACGGGLAIGPRNGYNFFFILDETKSQFHLTNHSYPCSSCRLKGCYPVWNPGTHDN